jgi:uncharacterized membrane protein YqgA involved in biofilm formation
MFFLTGTIVNAIAIIIGGLLGLLLGKKVHEHYKKIIMQGISLSVIIIGISMAIKTQNMLLLIISMALGSICGQGINLEDKLQKFGDRLQKAFSKEQKESFFAKGFIMATLVFCVGSMAIVGSIEGGLNGNHNILYAKAILDGIASLIFASTLGSGVIFSFFPVLIYQGTIAFIAKLAQPFLHESVINEMSAVGGVLIFAIGIILLEIKEIKVGNMLPAIFIPFLYGIIVSIF